MATAALERSYLKRTLLKTLLIYHCCIIIILMKLKTKLNISRTYNFKTDGWSYYLGSDGGRRRLPTPLLTLVTRLKILLGLAPKPLAHQCAQYGLQETAKPALQTGCS